MLSGLHYMHSNFILHRDLKPDNLMLTEDGTLKFIDFGMAKRFEEEVWLSQNQITAIYRPPEIFFGAKFYGYSADIWSLGCIMAELLIKRPLFPGQSEADILNRIFAIRGTPDVSKCLRWANHLPNGTRKYSLIYVVSSYKNGRRLTF